MYSFLVKAAPRPEEAYQFFTYRGKRPVVVNFRGRDISIGAGQRFGVRPSANGRHIRLVFPGDVNRVITLDLPTAQKLANGVGKS
jgi:hypothetical protein